MLSCTRRSLLAGGAALVLTSQTAFAADSEKTRFLKEASQDIKKGPQKPELPGESVRQIERLCIPVPFADFDYYYTKGLLKWSSNPGQPPQTIIVPEGFCTDLASVPQLFWSLLPKTGRYAYAAIVHDFLSWTQTGTRLQADDVLFAAMEDSSVNSLTKWTIYEAVRGFGGAAWDGNMKAKADGEKRFLKILPPADQLTSWAEWKKDAAHFSA